MKIIPGWHSNICTPFNHHSGNNFLNISVNLFFSIQSGTKLKVFHPIIGWNGFTLQMTI